MSATATVAPSAPKSVSTVLIQENQPEFDEIFNALRAEHQPATTHQAFLVERLAISQWQLARARRIESHAFDLIAMAESGADDPDSRIVRHFLSAGRDPITTFQRAAAQAERSYDRAWRELKAAKQIQNEANFVAALDARTVTRMINAPTLDHPAYGSQYGHTHKTKPIPAYKTNPIASKPSAPAQSKPSLRSQMPENLALCL
jgi:hypothetical protein